MTLKKLKILSQFKTPLPLANVEVIKVYLPYEDGRMLEKQNCNVVDAEKGIVEFGLTDFELAGLKVGKSTFAAKVYMTDGTLYSVSFANGMNIAMMDEKKVWV